MHPESPAAMAGIVDGDIIVEIASHSVVGMSSAEVRTLLAECGGEFDVIIARG